MTTVAPHLVHGMGMTLVPPTWPPITMAEAQAVVTRFPDVGDFVALRWHSPRPFSSAALVRTSRGEYFLKRHHRSVRSPIGLTEEHAFIAHLNRKGVSVPQVMLAEDGTGTVANREWIYELHRKAVGRDLYRDSPSWTPFQSNHHAQTAGAALARLHQAAADFDAPARSLQPLVSSFTILPAADPLSATEDYVAARPALAAFLADRPWQQTLTYLFTKLGTGLSQRLTTQASLWTHNDWHPSNLLWTAQGTVRTAFDFGLADRTCAHHDIAIAIERSALLWLRLGHGMDDNLADADAALAIIEGYRSVLPLTASDVETIVRLLPLVHIEFALSEMDYFAGVLADPDAAAMAWDGFLVAHAQWFLSAPGQEFLTQIEKGAGA